MSSPDSTTSPRSAAGNRRLLDLIQQHPGVADAAIVCAGDAEAEPVVRLVAHPRRAADVARLLEYQSRGLLAGQKQYALPDGTLIVHHNKGESDFVYSEIFDDNCYLRHGIRLRDGDCVFDVGANIGLFSLYMSRLPFTVNVFAFEPLPPTFQLLDTNRAICGMNDVRAFSYGLSDKAGVATFSYYAQNSIMSGRYADLGEDGGMVKRVKRVKRFLMRQREAAGMTDKPSDAVFSEIVKHSIAAQHFECELRTLSDVIAAHQVKRIDLLKIDVEKSEFDVLKGIREEDWPKIGQVVMEVFDGAGQLAKVYRLLRQHGFRPTVEQDANLRGTQVYMVYATRGDGWRDGAGAEPCTGKELPCWRNNPALLVEDVRRHVLACSAGVDLPRSR